MSSIKTHSWLFALGTLLLLSPLSSLAQSTSTSAATAANKDSKSDEIVSLSPFVVGSGEGESGYAGDVATSGSRLKSNLKDIASSVSVLTNAFMNDLGANNVAAAMAFVGGAETDATFHNETVLSLGGPNGYVGGDFGDNNNRTDYIRVRGLGQASVTQDFIEVLGSTDRYNTDRTEFLRGANSILFGLAQPAGLVNSSTKVANLRRNRASFESKFDNFGSQRWVLDISRVLLPGKLAFRIVGLDGDQQYQVKTAFQKDRRLFLTSSFRPFTGTTITAYFEKQHAMGRRPNYRTVQDNVSEWLHDYNTYAPKMTQAQIDQAFFWDPTTQKGLAAPSSTFTLSDGSTVNLGLIRRPLDTRPQGTTLIYSGNGDWTNPLGNLATNLANRTVTGANATPASAQVQFFRSGASRENDPHYLADPQVTDSGIFPYNTVEIAALPGSYRWENDDKFHINIDQRITDDFYISAAYQHENWNEEQYFASLTQSNQISIDITKTLPDGRPNPNFLRPFIYGRNIAENNKNKSDNYVVQANYDFDFAKKSERWAWLGSHRLTGIYTRKEATRLGYWWHYIWDNDVPVGLTAANILQTSPNRWLMQMWYVGDPVKLGDTSLRFTGFPDTLNAQWNRSYDYKFWNNTASPASWQMASAQVHAGRQLVNNTAHYDRQTNQGYGFSLQSFFLNKRLVTLFGWRRDSVDSFQGAPAPATLATFPVVPGISPADYPTGNSYTNQADTATESVVFKIDDHLRAFANSSENFAATAPRLDNLYRTLPAPTGQTKEFGLGLTLLGGRLNVRLTHFKSSQQNADAVNNVARLRVVDFENNLYNALSNAGRLSEWSTIAPGGGTTTAQYANPTNAASTQDVVSKGDSIEIYFTPSPRWDVVLGFDRLDNKTTHLGTQVMDFLNLRAPFYKKYFDQGLRLDGTTSPTSTSTLLSDYFVTTIAANYVNELIGEGTSNRGISKYNAKFVGRYKFIDGPLKGLAVGANLRWESGKILGYAQQTTSFNFGGLQNYPGLVYDPSHAYTGPEVVAGGLMISYEHKIYSGKVNWRIQLNSQNLFSKTGLVEFAANPDGSPIWARNPDRVYELSNTFEF